MTIAVRTISKWIGSMIVLGMLSVLAGCIVPETRISHTEEHIAEIAVKVSELDKAHSKMGGELDDLSASTAGSDIALKKMIQKNAQHIDELIFLLQGAGKAKKGQ